MWPGPVILKRHIHNSESDPFVDEVQLLHANPQYVYIRYGDDWESTISIRHLTTSGGVARPSSESTY